MSDSTAILFYGFTYSGDAVDFTQLSGAPFLRNGLESNNDSYLVGISMRSKTALEISKNYILMEESTDDVGYHFYGAHSKLSKMLPYQEYPFPAIKTIADDGFISIALSWTFGVSPKDYKETDIYVFGFREKFEAENKSTLGVEYTFLALVRNVLSQGGYSPSEVSVVFNDTVISPLKSFAPFNDSKPIRKVSDLQ